MLHTGAGTLTNPLSQRDVGCLWCIVEGLDDADSLVWDSD